MTNTAGRMQSAARTSPGRLPLLLLQDVSFESLVSCQGSEEDAYSEIPRSDAQISPSCRFGHDRILPALLRKHGDIRHGMLLHHYMVLNQLESCPVLGSHLLHMYFRCKSPENGFALSASMSELNVYSWNHLLEEYMEHGNNQKPLELFTRMQELAVLPNKITFLSVIKVMAHQPVEIDVSRIHSRISSSELGQNTKLRTALLRNYGAGGKMTDATKIFDATVGKDVVLWTNMIDLYAEHNQIAEALHLYERMQQNGLNPSMITYVSLLSMCAKLEALDQGEIIYGQIIVDGFDFIVTIGNSLVNMYGKCASLDDAYCVFGKMLEKNILTWTCMIKLYARKGYGKAALLLFDRLKVESILPNKFTLVEAIVACACIEGFDEGKRTHAQLCEIENVDAVAGAALVNMYGKCGYLGEAENVFGIIVDRDLVLWSVIITAYSQNGKTLEAIKLLESLLIQGTQLDVMMLNNITSLFARCTHLECENWVHAYIMESVLEPNLIVGNALVHLYAEFGDLEHTAWVFHNLTDRDVVSWTVMIAAYVTAGRNEDAARFFDQMHQEGQLPDKSTYGVVLDSLGSSCSEIHFKQMHVRLKISGHLDSEITVQNAFITLCDKQGNLPDAESIFTLMAKRDLVTWNAMISIFSSLGETNKVIDMFKQMLSEEIRPNTVTFVKLVSACASPASFIASKLIHTWAVNMNLHLDCILGTAFVTMYGNFGSIEDSRKCFVAICERNLCAWNAMMAVYSQHGKAKETIELFQEMRENKAIPDSLSFLAIISACNCCGLFYEGKKFFTLMVQEYDILPTKDHCGCLVELFEKYGWHNEAEAFLSGLAFQSSKTPDVSSLGTVKLESDKDQEKCGANRVYEQECLSVTTQSAI